MKAKKIIDQILQHVTIGMHAKRQITVSSCVLSILDGNPVSVTRIGRGI